MHRILWAIILWMGLSVSLAFAEGASEEKTISQPKIAITKETEAGEKILLATLTLQGEPLEGVEVAFFVKRTFGWLSLGKEVTLDDGTAAVPFPEDLPVPGDGHLEIKAQIVSPESFASLEQTVRLEGGVPVVFHEEPFPRALWAPRAPVPLLWTLSLILVGVWGTYFYVIVQLLRIGRE